MLSTRATDRFPAASRLRWLIVVAGVLILAGPSWAQQPAADKPDSASMIGPSKSSYDQVTSMLMGHKTFEAQMADDKAEKNQVMARQKALLEERYDLSVRTDPTVKMTRGKPIPVGPATKLPRGATWDTLANMSPDDIRAQSKFPKGFLPLPHPKHQVGGMVFPQNEIKLLPRLERFDIDFDLPDHFLPEFPPAIFLTTRPDLGDVSQGKVLTVENFQLVFGGILNAKDLEGVRLLVTQFPQQQFNATADRKTSLPLGMQGVACLDCHVNGHTSGATHLVGDIRPQSHRRRIDTPSLRGVNIQRLFGSQRAARASRTSQSSSSVPPTSMATTSRRWPRGSIRWSVVPKSTSWRRSRNFSISRPPPDWASTASSTHASSILRATRCAGRSCSLVRPSARHATPPRITPTIRCIT